jgi:hypothetical protein
VGGVDDFREFLSVNHFLKNVHTDVICGDFKMTLIRVYNYMQNCHKSPSYCGKFLALTPTILAMADPLLGKETRDRQFNIRIIFLKGFKNRFEVTKAAETNKK